jgi:N-carbamoylputrescine amidase
MKITVCELSNDPDRLEREWIELAGHVRAAGSELLVLPEMPFHPWVARSKEAAPGVWRKAVQAHDNWLQRLTELAPATVVGTRPVIQQGRHFNEGFIWEPESGYRGVHQKYYLPDEAGFWEASWYERGPFEFATARCGPASAGFLICSEIWFSEHARFYGKKGIHLLLCPRATPLSSADKWVAGGRTAAVVSGAFCLSSNFHNSNTPEIEWGGTGWIIEPEEGRVLGLTSADEPFLTLDIDLRVAEAAKKTYPRYLVDESELK